MNFWYGWFKKCNFVYGQLRVRSGKQVGHSGVTNAHRGSISRAPDHQLGRYSVGETTSGIVGRPGDFGDRITNRGTITRLSRIQGMSLHCYLIFSSPSLSPSPIPAAVPLSPYMMHDIHHKIYNNFLIQIFFFSKFCQSNFWLGLQFQLILKNFIITWKYFLPPEMCWSDHIKQYQVIYKNIKSYEIFSLKFNLYPK